METALDFSALYTRLRDPDLVHLARYCETLRRGHDLPRWHDFRPGDVSYMLGRLFVVDVLDGGADYFFRLCGVYLSEIYGVDIAAHRVSELPPGAFSDTVRRNYDQVVSSQRPLCERGEFRWSAEQRIGVERLLIPFADDQGRLHTILGGVQCDVPLDILVLFRGKGEGLFLPHVEPLPGNATGIKSPVDVAG